MVGSYGHIPCAPFSSVRSATLVARGGSPGKEGKRANIAPSGAIRSSLRLSCKYTQKITRLQDACEDKMKIFFFADSEPQTPIYCAVYHTQVPIGRSSLRDFRQRVVIFPPLKRRAIVRRPYRDSRDAGLLLCFSSLQGRLKLAGRLNGACSYYLFKVTGCISRTDLPSESLKSTSTKYVPLGRSEPSSVI